MVLWAMYNLAERCESLVKFLLSFFSKKVLADGTVGLFVDLRLSAVRQHRFFCQAFLDKKAGFWLLFSKSNINY